MKAYSLDLRERIMHAVATGMTKSRAARTFAVSLATVKNYTRQLQQTGSLVPRPIPGRPRAISAEQEAALVVELRAAQDATLDELRARWEQRTGVTVSAATMSRTLKRLKWTRKKRRWVPPSATRSPARPG